MDSSLANMLPDHIEMNAFVSVDFGLKDVFGSEAISALRPAAPTTHNRPGCTRTRRLRAQQRHHPPTAATAAAAQEPPHGGHVPQALDTGARGQSWGRAPGGSHYVAALISHLPASDHPLGFVLGRLCCPPL